MKTYLIFFYSLFISAAVWAGDIKGNGGGAILCKDQFLEILDFYEANSLGYGKPDFGGAVLENEIKSVYLDRLAVHSPQRSEIYRQWLNDFESEAVFIENIPIEDISDLGVSLPDQCSWHQIVNQNSILLGGGKKYLIDRTLWGQLSPSQKVGLMMHELFYRESTSKTSKGLRLLNALLATNQLNQIDLLSRSKLFADAGLGWMESQGIAFLLGNTAIIQNDQLQEATALKGSTFRWQNQSLILREDLVSFHANGAVKSLKISNSLKIKVGSSQLLFTNSDYSKDALKFFENGQFQEGPNDFSYSSLKNENCHLAFSYAYFSDLGRLVRISRAQGYVTILSQNYPVYTESEVHFYPNEGVMSFMWPVGSSLVVNSQTFYPKNFSIVQLSELGKVSAIVTTSGETIQFP